MNKNKSPVIRQAITQPDQSNTPLFCSGYGQRHTDKYGKPLAVITWSEITAMVLNPQEVDKTQARWFIPSNLQTRNHAEQEQKGQFWALWADFDDTPKPIADVSLFWERLTDSCDAIFYSSKSAAIDRQKSRLIAPLANPLSGSDWMLAAECLNDALEAAGFIPDRASQRTGQLCYLPNRGAFYDGYTLTDGNYFDPLTFFADQIKEKKAAIVAAEAALEQSRKAAEANRNRFSVSGGTSAVDAFNACHDVADVLLKAGYKQRGNHFRHPHSESGSYSASIRNGRVYSLSPNDPLFTTEGAHDAFSAWAVLFFGGDMTAAAQAVYALLRRAA